MKKILLTILSLSRSFTLRTIIFFFVALSVQAGIGSGKSATGPLPVELVSLTANVNGNVVVLNWTTATEVNNYGFDVQRAVSGTEEWETIGFVNGHGNSNSPKDYSFVDASNHGGKVSYRLKQIDVDGSFNYSMVVELNTSLVKEFMLEQNYPNPFNPTTVISYSIPTDSHVSIKVYDVLGNLISTLVNKNQTTGIYKVDFDANELNNGVYFYKIQAGNFTSVKKMLLLK